MLLQIDFNPFDVVYEGGNRIVLVVRDNGEHKKDVVEVSTVEGESAEEWKQHYYSSTGKGHTYTLKVGPRGHLSLKEIR